MQNGSDCVCDSMLKRTSPAFLLRMGQDDRKRPKPLIQPVKVAGQLPQNGAFTGPTLTEP